MNDQTYLKNLEIYDPIQSNFDFQSESSSNNNDYIHEYHDRNEDFD